MIYSPVSCWKKGTLVHATTGPTTTSADAATAEALAAPFQSTTKLAPLLTLGTRQHTDFATAVLLLATLQSATAFTLESATLTLLGTLRKTHTEPTRTVLDTSQSTATFAMATASLPTLGAFLGCFGGGWCGSLGSWDW